MKRIFLALGTLSTLLLLTALVLGWSIGDPKAPPSAEGWSPKGIHILVGVLALVFATMVHALVFTYFMGTGRWMEETTKAYRLDTARYKELKADKYRLLPGIGASFLLMLATVIFGALADPGAMTHFRGWLGIPPGTIHMLIALTAVAVNVWAYLAQFLALDRNATRIQGVLDEVRRIREEKGLPV